MSNSDYQSEIVKLKETIKNLENEVKTLKNENNNIIRRIDILETIFLNQNKNKKINFDNYSNIESNETKLNFVIKQIYINNNISPDKKCNLNLIYRATRDGDDVDTYHKKTNYVPDTLTLIRTKDGYIFGGFTHIQIPNCNGANFNDDKAFIFSLDYNKIYLPQTNHWSKHSNDNYGPIFGNNENETSYPIIIYGRNFFNNNNHHTCPLKNCVYNNFSFDYELNKGKSNFKVDEIEVYKVNFE